mmetsp:Transcript_16140/g.41440  ORF Transcript_16140/g.41440 Transcript_16140/m.41440 type:complete len:225 (-) Transcript_16140:929-1603(-)
MLQRTEGDACTVRLLILVVGDHAHHAMPERVADGVAGQRDQPQDALDVPGAVADVALCQDGDLDHQLVVEAVVLHVVGALLQEAHQLGHDALAVLQVAHAEEQVECTPADADVRVADRHDHRVQMPRHQRHAVRRRRDQVVHALEREVAHVRLLARHELAQHVRRLLHDGGALSAAVHFVRLEMAHQRERLEQNTVLGVALVHRLAAGVGVRDHVFEHLNQCFT